MLSGFLSDGGSIGAADLLDRAGTAPRSRSSKGLPTPGAPCGASGRSRTDTDRKVLSGAPACTQRCAGQSRRSSVLARHSRSRAPKPIPEHNRYDLTQLTPKNTPQTTSPGVAHTSFAPIGGVLWRTRLSTPRQGPFLPSLSGSGPCAPLFASGASSIYIALFPEGVSGEAHRAAPRRV